MIDDCSTDGSGEICENYKDKYMDRKVEVFHNEVNTGQSCAREKAVCYANTEWIYVIAADDLIHPDLVKTLMNFVMSPMGCKTDILEVGTLGLNDREISQYSWESLENPRFMIKYGNDVEVKRVAKKLPTFPIAP